MIRSMTGFGRAERSAGTMRVGVEIRAVNNRHAEVRLKLPPALAPLEEPLRKRLAAAVQRGRADATVTLAGQDRGAPVEVNHALIRGYLEAGRDVARRHGLEGEISLESVLSLPGAVSVRLDDCRLSARERRTVEAAFEAAVKELDRSRLREGKHLAADLSRRLRVVQRHRAAVASRAKGSSQRWARRIEERLAESGLAGRVDPARFAQEVALLAGRGEITEELVRLEAHLEAAAALFAEPGEPVGRKLDFLLQEMHREANTINSKSEDLAISRHALAIKAELEKIREQAQNIE